MSTLADENVARKTVLSINELIIDRRRFFWYTGNVFYRQFDRHNRGKTTFMSGHSKWSTIKRQKGVADAKRSSIFSKYSRLISIAARVGGKDPASNFRLRLAIDKAKAANMPNDNIERAIKAGAGELKDGQVKEALYEGFGPAGVAVLVQAVTDNSNRTSADLRSLFQKYDGALGGQNSVAWMFQLRGIVRISSSQISQDKRAEIELGAIDAGAEDVREENDALVIITSAESLSSMKNWLEALRLTPEEADVEYLPTVPVVIDDAARQKLHSLLSDLDEHPDVTNLFTNDA